MKRGDGLKRTTRLAPVNRARKAERYERNFAGDQEKRVGDKREWIGGFVCDVSRRYGVEAAHRVPRGMGGAGGDATTLVPLHKEVHADFDGRSLPYLDDAAFEAKWGRSRESVRERAAHYEHLWQTFGPNDSEGLSF